MDTARSLKLYKEALCYMPGGVNSPVRAFRAVDKSPLFIDRAKGCRIYDEDGNSYINYVGSWGPDILGAAYDDVIDSVRDAIDKGLSYGAPTKRETELAKLITQTYPAIERLRLVNSGTEAVMSAVRVARGYTKRDKIVKFTGGYHGHSDGMLVAAGSGSLTNSVPDSAGVPISYAEDTLLAGYNDADSVAALFKMYPDQIAAVIVEPVAANMGVVPPTAGFLESLRDITKAHGALLIFDEVITGYRLALGGACELYGIKPDLATLGKIVGGGMPLAAYGGRADIMSIVAPEGEVYQAGTLSGNPIATSAGLATLNILKNNPDIYESLDKRSSRLENALRGISGVCVNRVGSLVCAFFTDRKVHSYEDVMTSDTWRYARYFSYMLDHGIYIAPSQYEAMFVSAAHTDKDIEYTAQVIEDMAKLSVSRKKK